MKDLRSGFTSDGTPTRPEGAREVFFDYIRHPAYKRLLNQVVAAQDKQNVRSVAVLSEFPGEGKTFFVSVLALGFATFLRKRVLIMDTISQTRNESFYMGTILGHEASDVEGMPGRGRPGAIDLITTRNLRRQIRVHTETLEFEEGEGDDDVYDTADFQIGPFITALAPSYDLILLDTCALSEVTKDNIDPIILAQQADASIVVTSRESLDRQILNKISNDLKRSSIRLLGTIFNAGPQS